MYKLNFKKRVWIVKRYLKGDSAAKIALAQNVHMRCVYQLLERYKEFSWDGLKDCKTGRPETILNPYAEIILLNLRKTYGYIPKHKRIYTTL